jgi:F0F1-type ATP synthase assembly protein I
MKIKMNKNGKSIFSTLLTGSFITAIILLIVFLIWGAGGGFSTIAGVGSLMKQIPAWFWIVVAMIWLTKAMFGGNR